MKLKLKCPMCNTEFTSSNRNKVRCTKRCTDKYREITLKTKINKELNLRCENKFYRYDLNLNKWYINTKQ